MEALLIALVIGLLAAAGCYALEPMFHAAVVKAKHLVREVQLLLPRITAFFQ